jgi:hypothetical protein
MQAGCAQFNPNGTLSTVEQAYVVRQFERAALEHLTANRWVLLLGPHKCGKSSALMRIQARLKDSGYACAFMDLQSYVPADDTYADFLEWFAEKLSVGIGADFTRPPKRQRKQLDSWLRTVVTPEFQNTAILVDEASGVPEPFRVPFFSQLRAVFNSRGRAHSPEGEFAGRIVFIFAGTFRPNGMIDNANSPFNVSLEINPDDLTLDEVAELAALGLAGDVAVFARRAWEATHGQPYYVQHLFAALQGAGDSPAQRAAAFDAALDELWRGAHGHLEHLTRTVDRDAQLRALVPGILDGNLSFQAGSSVHNYAIVTGVARVDAGCLIPRNPIYAGALARFADERYP